MTWFRKQRDSTKGSPPPQGMRERLKLQLDRFGLLLPAFRFMEAIKANKDLLVHGRKNQPTGSDGIPVPPAKLIVLVGGTTDAAAFLEGGAQNADAIQSVLSKNNLALEGMQAVLDFGCGSGRVIRHLKDRGIPELYGTDYSEKAIAWCRKNLMFAEFETNQYLPPLNYGDAKFDFVYAISVFTHMTEPAQVAWIAELARVIRPRGHLFITVHGQSYRDSLWPSERDTFDRGNLVVRYESVEGTNLCAAFHPQAYLEKLAADDFRLIDIVPQAAIQDAVLLERLGR